MAGPFKCRIKNFITNPVRVGIFGKEAEADFRVDISAGGTFTSPDDLHFLGGHRMVVVWDNLSVGNHPIVASLHINMTSDTGLDIKPNGITAFTLA